MWNPAAVADPHVGGLHLKDLCLGTPRPGNLRLGDHNSTAPHAKVRKECPSSEQTTHISDATGSSNQIPPGL